MGFEDLFEGFGEQRRRGSHGSHGFGGHSDHGHDHGDHDDDRHTQYRDRDTAGMETFPVNREGNSDSFRDSAHHGRDQTQMYREYAQKILANKPLLIGLCVAAVFLLLFVLIAGLIILSALAPLLGYVNENGVKGIVETILALLQKIWLGNS